MVLEVDLFSDLALAFLDLDLLREREDDFRRFLFFNCFDFPLFLDTDLDLDLCLDFSPARIFLFFWLRDLLPDRFLLFFSRLRERIFLRIFSATGNFFFITIFLFFVPSFTFFPFSLPFFKDRDLDLDLEVELELEELELEELELKLSEEEEEVDLFLDLLDNFRPRDLERLVGFLFFSFFLISLPNSSLSAFPFSLLLSLSPDFRFSFCSFLASRILRTS